MTRGGEIYEVNHNRDDIIGRGSFGEVKIGRTQSGQQVAVKVTTTSKDRIAAAKKEIEFLSNFTNDDNIVKLIGFEYFEDKTGHRPPHLTFAMELAECSLDKLMRDGSNIRGLPQNVLTDLVMDCYSAMKSLRSKRVAHRDIKHLNILVFRCKERSRKSTYLFKFCDLGNASLMTDDYGMNSLVGTPNVLHPKLSTELARGRIHRWKVDDKYSGDECDLWSLACTLYFAASGHYPFPHHHQNASVYHNAVIDCPKDSISATLVDGPNKLEYKYEKQIPSQRYPQWFRVAFSTLIRNLLHEPNLDNYGKIAQALVESREYTFLSLTQLDIVKYADVSQEPLLSENHPTIRQVLEVPEGVQCLLFGSDDDEIQDLPKDLNLLNVHSSYLILPVVRQLVLSPKTWKTEALPERFENLVSKEEHLEVRAAHIGEAFLALYDADKMYTLFDTGTHIFRQHLKKLRIQVITTKESAAYPLRFAAYGNCYCQAWLTHNTEDREKAFEGMSKAASATKGLTKCLRDLDQLLKHVDEMLKWLDELKLDERELPGMEAELIRYMFCDRFSTDSYNEEVQKSTPYTTSLVQKCYNRRTAIADDFCGKTNNTKNAIRINMIQGLKQISTMKDNLKHLKVQVEDNAFTIELPFQAMKNRVERENNTRNITEKDIQRSVAFHNNPHRVYSSAAEVRELAQKLRQTMDSVKRNSNQ